MLTNAATLNGTGMSLNKERLCALLAQNMGPGATVSLAEFDAAEQSIRDILDSTDAARFIDDHRNEFPAVLAPLLGFRVALAQNENNGPLVEVLKLILARILKCRSLPPGCATASCC